ARRPVSEWPRTPRGPRAKRLRRARSGRLGASPAGRQEAEERAQDPPDLRDGDRIPRLLALVDQAVSVFAHGVDIREVILRDPVPGGRAVDQVLRPAGWSPPPDGQPAGAKPRLELREEPHDVGALEPGRGGPDLAEL